MPDLSSSGATHCVHAAWYTDHADYLTHEINREWMAASLRLAEAFPGRFVGLGTCLEYDVASAAGPLGEDGRSGRTRSTPGASSTCSKRSPRAVRISPGRAIFFVYGPGDRDGRLVPQMIERFARGEVAGPPNGGLRRDYVHVDDLAGQIVRIATSDVRGPINAGTGEAPTLSEIYAAGAGGVRPARSWPERNCETGGQPRLIQADLARFRRPVGEPQARDHRRPGFGI